MINETFYNLSANVELLKLSSSTLKAHIIEADWIQSWNIGIMFFIILLIIIWNIILTFQLNKLMGKEK